MEFWEALVYKTVGDKIILLYGTKSAPLAKTFSEGLYYLNNRWRNLTDQLTLLPALKHYGTKESCQKFLIEELFKLK